MSHPKFIIRKSERTSFKKTKSFALCTFLTTMVFTSLCSNYMLGALLTISEVTRVPPFQETCYFDPAVSKMASAILRLKCVLNIPGGGMHMRVTTKIFKIITVAIFRQSNAEVLVSEDMLARPL